MLGDVTHRGLASEDSRHTVSLGEMVGLVLLVLAAIALATDVVLGVVSIHSNLVASMSSRRRIADVVFITAVCLIGPGTLILLSSNVFKLGISRLRRASMAGYVMIGVAFLVTCVMVQVTYL